MINFLFVYMLVAGKYFEYFPAICFDKKKEDVQVIRFLTGKIRPFGTKISYI